MSNSVFEQVRLAESQADQIVQEAHKKAREYIKTAEAECVETERSMVKEHRVLYRSILEEKTKKVEDSIKANAEANKLEIQKELEHAKKRIPIVLAFITERVLSYGNH